MSKIWIWCTDGMITEDNQSTWRKGCLLPLCAAKIPHRLVWNWIRAPRWKAARMVLQFKKLHLTFSNILEKAINEIDLQINIQNFSPFLNIDLIIFYYYKIYQDIKTIKIIDLMFLVSRVRFQPGCLLNPSFHSTLLNTCWWESTGEYENNVSRHVTIGNLHLFYWTMMIPIYTNAPFYSYYIPTTLVPQTLDRNKLSYYQFNDLKLKYHQKHKVIFL